MVVCYSSIVVYYAAQLVFGALLGIFDGLFDWGIDWEGNNVGLNLLGIPIGLLGDYVFYFLLERNWEKNVVLVKDEIQDIGKPTEDLD